MSTIWSMIMGIIPSTGIFTNFTNSRFCLGSFSAAVLIQYHMRGKAYGECIGDLWFDNWQH